MERIFDDKTLRRISEEFTRTKDICYLDHAGATLYSETQIRNISHDLICNTYGNPHSLNQCSKECTDLIDQIRLRILHHFHTTNEVYSVIFTAGATAAIKLVLENFDWEASLNVKNEICYNSSTDKNNKISGAYVYTQSNHTSIVGGREIAKQKNIPFYCLQYKESYSVLSSEVYENSIKNSHVDSNSLFAFPAQCNFSGEKFPLEWIQKVKNGSLDDYGLQNNKRNSKWFCLLDAATYCSTNDLNLSVYHPDFVCISFYKIFGYPTGLGALLVKNSSAYVLDKTYFGGGTVEISLPFQNFHKKRKLLHEKFEDGTIPFLSIIALAEGLNTLNRLSLNMDTISAHTFSLAKYAVNKLKTLVHWNGAQVVELYADSDYDNIRTQGGIVNFNLKRSSGHYIGFVEVLHIANLRKIYIRTGCFCNTGSCQRHLKLSDADLKFYHQVGHVCGDSMDLIDGKPTGSIRISFGYMSTPDNVDQLVDMIKDSFVENVPQIRQKDKSFDEERQLKLTKILLYPIKSCGGLEVNFWKIGNKGLKYDREWMIVTGNGVCLTQKQEPKLCLIHPELDLQNQLLHLRFDEDENVITLPIESSTILSSFNMCASKVCNDLIQTYDCGDEVGGWLSYQLNRPGLRLLRQAGDDARQYKDNKKGNFARSENAGKLSLSNQAQYLLINNESAKWLQEIIGQDEEINSETFLYRFRGNFYVTGAKEFSENNWNKLTIGSLQFKVNGPCNRCQMICIDQQNGQNSRKPLVALSKALSGKLQFGIYLSCIESEQETVVKVGDIISVE